MIPWIAGFLVGFGIGALVGAYRGWWAGYRQAAFYFGRTADQQGVARE